MMPIFRHYVFGMAAAVLPVVMSPPAHATLQLALDIGPLSFTCVDNQACDTNPTVGIIDVGNQNIGGIEVNGSIQTSVGTLATPNPLAILNTGSLSLINGTDAPISAVFAVSDTNFVGPVSAFASAGSGVWESAGGSTLTMNWYNDPTNTQGADTGNDTPGILLDTFTSTAVGQADSFSHNGSGAVSDPGLFSMTLQASGTLVAGGSLLNRGQTLIKTPTAVPEPASLSLLGFGMVGIGVVLQRRRKNGSC